MKAIVIENGTSNLIWSDCPDPSLDKHEVLVKVYASAVNRADLLQHAGKYPAPYGASLILGLEVAGTVEKLGSKDLGFQVGERVFCILAGGGYAEYVSVPASHLMRIPENLSFEQAASIPEAFFTAYLNLVVEGKLTTTETVLIHAAASGVGTASVQLAKSLGARVLATAGSDEKCKCVKELGADECINYKTSDILPSYKENTIDLILDMVGQKHLTANLKLLRYRGRLIMLSLISGTKTEIDLYPLLKKNICIKGSTLRDRSNEEKAELTRQFQEKILPMFNSGALKAIISKQFPIQEVQEAHDFVASNSNLGKVVLKII